MSDQVSRLDKPFGAYALAGANWQPDQELTSVGPQDAWR